MKNILFILFSKIPLKLRLKIFYWIKFHKKLNLESPKLYSEKIQKRKLNIINEYSTLSDKYKVRQFIESKLGEKYLIKLLKHYNSPNDIKLSDLPNKFVIKTNFGSGNQHIQIVRNKNNVIEAEVIDKFTRAMAAKYKGSILGETQYDMIEKKIIIEEFIDNNGKDIDDFKFHIFNSSDGFLQVDFDRFTDHKRNLYNFKYERLPYDLCHSGGDYNLPPISKLNEMKDVAFKLSKGFDYVRVDLYLVKDQILFGEMTFTPGNGFEKFSTPEADYLYGKMWKQE
ncbi:ATP-grasp fold amidoligase family protein [Morganella morganii]|uniref:ATP-grasp fold amidoligase family protein n=1 Tax=Morganella morganii TaxID=582 RepID=UPI00332BB64E